MQRWWRAAAHWLTLCSFLPCFLSGFNYLSILIFQDKFSPCSPACPGTYFVDQVGLKVGDFPASASGMLGLKVCASMPHLAQGWHHCLLTSIHNQEKCRPFPPHYCTAQSAGSNSCFCLPGSGINRHVPHLTKMSLLI